MSTLASAGGCRPLVCCRPRATSAHRTVRRGRHLPSMTVLSYSRDRWPGPGARLAGGVGERGDSTAGARTLRRRDYGREDLTGAHDLQDSFPKVRRSQTASCPSPARAIERCQGQQRCFRFADPAASCARTRRSRPPPFAAPVPVASLASATATEASGLPFASRTRSARQRERDRAFVLARSEPGAHGGAVLHLRRVYRRVVHESRP